MAIPTVQVTIRVTLEQRAQLDALCAYWGTGPTATLVRAVADALAREQCTEWETNMLGKRVQTKKGSHP